MNWPKLKIQLQQLAKLLDAGAVSIRQKVKEIVPEYQQPGMMDTPNKKAFTVLLAAKSQEQINPVELGGRVN